MRLQMQTAIEKDLGRSLFFTELYSIRPCEWTIASNLSNLDKVPILLSFLLVYEDNDFRHASQICTWILQNQVRTPRSGARVWILELSLHRDSQAFDLSHRFWQLRCLEAF